MKEHIRICTPQDCVTLLRRYSRMRQEHFGVIFLNSQREVIQTKCFFVGSDNINLRILQIVLCIFYGFFRVMRYNKAIQSKGELICQKEAC